MIRLCDFTFAYKFGIKESTLPSQFVAIQLYSFCKHITIYMAIMTKSVLLITLLVTIIAASQVNAQLGGLLGGGLPGLGGGLPGLGGGGLPVVGGGGLPVVGGGGLPVVGGGGLPVVGGGGLPVVGGGGLPVVGGLLQLLSITGQVSCSPNATVGVNGTVTAAPAFSNGIVELICGRTVVGSATTNTFGIFTILLSPAQTLNVLGINLSGLLSPVQALLASLLSPACNLVVTTPLSACNPSLPSTGGLLTSPLTLISTVIQGILSIVSLGPLGFVLSAV